MVLATILARLAKPCSGTCYGIDPSYEMLIEARSRQPTVDFQLGSGEELPFDNDRFDLLYSVDVIHHVPDGTNYFKEANRVLKPGGRICTATDSADDIRGRRPLASHFPETVPVELARYPSIERLITYMEQTGLTGLESGDVEFAYRLSDLDPYRQRAFSCLHLIDERAYERGLRRMEADLADGPIEALSRYTLLWGMA